METVKRLEVNTLECEEEREKYNCYTFDDSNTRNLEVPVAQAVAYLITSWESGLKSRPERWRLSFTLLPYQALCYAFRLLSN